MLCKKTFLQKAVGWVQQKLLGTANKVDTQDSALSGACVYANNRAIQVRFDHGGRLLHLFLLAVFQDL